MKRYIYYKEVSVMYNRKSILIGVILMIFAVAVFAAGNKENTGLADDKVTLKYYVQIPTSFDPQIEQVISMFQEKYPNVEVSYEHLSDGTATEYLKRVDLLLLSGERVDIVTQPGPSDHYERASNGMFAPLTPLFEKEGVEYDSVYSIKTEIDGEVYGLPAYVGMWYILMNKDHLDEAGLPIPPDDWTWEDYREYAEKLTVVEGGETKRYGSYMHNWPMFNYAGMWSAKDDNPLFYKDGSSTYDHPAFGGFLKYRKQLEDDGFQMPYAVARANKTHYLKAFFPEEFSMQVIGSWTINAVQKTDKFPHDFPVAFAPIPRWSKDEIPQRTFSESAYYAINKDSDLKEEAFAFIRFLTTTGAPIIAKGFSAEKGADNSTILTEMMKGKEELYHIPSLKNVINNRVDNPTTYFPPYQAAVEEVIAEENEKYLFGGTTIEEWSEALKKRVPATIKNY